MFQDHLPTFALSPCTISCLCTCIRICIACACVCVYVHECLCVYVYIHVYVYVICICIHTLVCRYMHDCIINCMELCVQSPIFSVVVEKYCDAAAPELAAGRGVRVEDQGDWIGWDGVEFNRLFCCCLLSAGCCMIPLAELYTGR